MHMPGLRTSLPTHAFIQIHAALSAASACLFITVNRRPCLAPSHRRQQGTCLEKTLVTGPQQPQLQGRARYNPPLAPLLLLLLPPVSKSWKLARSTVFLDPGGALPCVEPGRTFGCATTGNASEADALFGTDASEDGTCDKPDGGTCEAPDDDGDGDAATRAVPAPLLLLLADVLVGDGLESAAAPAPPPPPAAPPPLLLVLAGTLDGDGLLSVPLFVVAAGVLGVPGLASVLLLVLLVLLAGAFGSGMEPDDGTLDAGDTSTGDADIGTTGMPPPLLAGGASAAGPDALGGAPALLFAGGASGGGAGVDAAGVLPTLFAGETSIGKADIGTTGVPLILFAGETSTGDADIGTTGVPLLFAGGASEASLPDVLHG